MKKIIEVKDLKKSYGKSEAVKGVNLEVNEGELFGFLGPNGAGKSTTINILCTMLKPSSGTALIGGYDVIRQKSKVRESIGIVFQDNTLDEKLTAKENLLLHCRFYNVPANERKSRVERVLEMVQLSDKKDKFVGTFSGGMKRRLEIARGLLHYPKVLFLDEPTVGLDPQTRANVWDYIIKLKEEIGITIFLTTHYMDEAEICNNIAIIDDGKIIATDTPKALKDSVGGDVIEISTEDNKIAKNKLLEKYNKQVKERNGIITFEVEMGEAFIVDFVKEFDVPIKSINLRKPTLNDVFLNLTGRHIRE
ncbi:daunorubicin resistance protein DrrA family ABC transporter ATP-binding protein [Ruminiclostridium josui]|uniref:daunorubicin resistance protein DrrA family ABC transporter ATP-binding protein n=1 Tax=Ruminiclostridium josui TaxID=1499 RepID=UPI000466DC2B|nr:daunorubicin resistance protein DrrA family ABC transporter ATP-binding protein [Ruminiclostridium josui]